MADKQTPKESMNTLTVVGGMVHAFLNGVPEVTDAYALGLAVGVMGGICFFAPVNIFYPGISTPIAIMAVCLLVLRFGFRVMTFPIIVVVIASAVYGLVTYPEPIVFREVEVVYNSTTRELVANLHFINFEAESVDILVDITAVWFKNDISKEIEMSELTGDQLQRCRHVVSIAIPQEEKHFFLNETVCKISPEADKPHHGVYTDTVYAKDSRDIFGFWFARGRSNTRHIEHGDQ